MKTAAKAALLSGLVFPGLGQMYLRQYRRGWLFTIPVLLGIILLAAMAASGALESLREIQARGAPANMETIVAVAQVHAREMAGTFRAVFFLMICCWLFSVIDAYRTGMKQGSRRPAPGETRPGTEEEP